MDQVITEKIRGMEIKLQTKPGVFSWRGLDHGTRLLIGQIEPQDRTVVADLGSGSGILGIAVAKLNSTCHVHLLEDHLRSFELAKENVDLNGLKNAEVYLSDLFSAVGDRTYQQIFSNPPAQLGNDFLEEVILESKKHLKLAGLFWIVVPQNIKPTVERLLEKHFGNCTIVTHGKEHVVLKAKKDGH